MPMYTHKDLLRNPNLLLSLDDAAPIHRDIDCALVAAVIDDGYSCITSKSCSFIPSPPIGGNRAVTERKDFYFGQDDYLVWPQPYHPSFPHLPFIHRREVDLADLKRDFLWLLPARSDFHLHDPESYTGLGKLSLCRFRKFEAFWNELDVRIRTQIPDDVPELMRQLMAMVAPLLDRLQYLAMGYNAMCRTVRALQRNVLEVEAFIDYLVIQRRMQQDLVSAVSPFTAITTIGAFVHSINDVTILSQMGVCHWLIRPYHNVLASRVQEVVPLQSPHHIDLSVEPSSPSHIIFVGSASDPAMYHAIRNYGYNCIRFPDPFHAKALPEPLRRSSGPTRPVTGRQRALTPKQRAKKFASDRAQDRFYNIPRSKFEDPECSFYPPGIPAWQEALSNVDTSSDRFVFEQVPSDSAYVVPEPAFMVSTKVAEKSMAMFRSWLKYRPILILRISSRSSLAQPKHGVAWSALLAAEYAEHTAKDKSPGVSAKERQRLREEMLSFMSNNIGSNAEVQLADTVDLSTAGCSWHGIPFDELGQQHFEQILWELAEINFRFEFQALDRRARIHAPHEHLPGADIDLMACVPNHSFAIPALETANHGIASLSSQERAHYLLAVARVMSKWRWVDKNGWIVKVDKLRWSLAEIEGLEKEIAVFYTQTFYDCFRRAPVIPRRLSESACAARPLVGREHDIPVAPLIDNNATIILNTESCPA